MTGHGVDGIDHLVIVVRDLERAHATYTRLGFTLTPRGRHTALKSANHTMMFADGDYLELMGFEEPHPVTAPFAALLDSREGLAAVALKTADARTSRAALAAAGFAMGEAVEFARPVELPGGTQEARFTLAQLPELALPAGRAFVCQHHSRDVVWRNDCLSHANTAVGLGALVVAAENPDATAEGFATLFGRGVEARGAVRVVATGGAPVVVGTARTLNWAWTGDPLLAGRGPTLVGAAIRVADAAAAQQALQASKLPVIGNGDVFRVKSGGAHGVALAFGVDVDLSALVP